MSVYFVTCREASAVKIGYSVDPYARLAELQLCCPLPLKLEAVRLGDKIEEARLHSWFADDRIHGEWFRLTEMIEAVMAASPAPPPCDAKPNPNYRVKKPRRPRDELNCDRHDEYERVADKLTEQLERLA